MSKTDKYPFLDPATPGIFDLIIATVADMRKQQRSSEFMQQQKREEQARGDRLRMRERESEKDEDAEWEARIRALPSFGALPKL